jgi:hypothetical protein
MLVWGVVLDRYGSVAVRVASLLVSVLGKGLHSSTFQLNLSSSVHRTTKLNS